MKKITLILLVVLGMANSYAQEEKIDSIITREKISIAWAHSSNLGRAIELAQTANWLPGTQLYYKNFSAVLSTSTEGVACIVMENNEDPTTGFTFSVEADDGTVNYGELYDVKLTDSDIEGIAQFRLIFESDYRFYVVFINKVKLKDE